MGRLDGKVVVVTGASRGIGADVARLFASEGGRVICAARTLQEGQHPLAGSLETTVAGIRETGGTAQAVAANIAEPAECARLVEEARRHYGPVDVLVNNAALTYYIPVKDYPVGKWLRSWAVNFQAPFVLSQLVLGDMIARRSGAIVNISSISALRPRGLTTYSASKGAVIALSRAMAVDHGPDGIRVNCIAPGPVYTPMVYARGMTPAARDQRRRASVLAREGTGWDIGQAARFLLSGHARYITGHVLVVDGGATLVGPARESQTEH